jgi:BirA family transcriptional regulator, biotin operon repressor / biotin---[acetyl-CoA-carboxylase] ligase
VADSLAPSAVRPLLSGRFGQAVYLYEERAPSTQRLLQPDHPEGAVAVAEEQSEGRGRLGRSWHAPARSSVLVSILLRPDVDSARLPELSLVMGGAVAEAIADVTELEPAIKFPNDVLLAGKKVAGILAESSDGRVVVGIGVNVNQTAEQLPADAQTEPTSLRLERGEPVDRAALLAAILLRVEGAYDAWRATPTGTSASG